MVSFDPPARGGGITTTVTGRTVTAKDSTSDTEGEKFTIALDRPLVAGDTVTLTLTLGDQSTSWNDTVPAIHDERGIFEASAYLGSSFDNFAAGEVNKYLNPEAAGDIQERFIAGFDFAYRLFGDVSQKASPGNPQIWLYGETLHGVRSTDVDCSAEEEKARPPVCKDATLDLANFPQRTRFILRKATSLEAYAGGGWEFFTFQPTSDSAANLYVKGQLGFLAVSRSGGDVIDSHHLGLGIIAVKGPLVGSYVEGGWGRTDLFLERPKGRWKMDGFLSFSFLPDQVKFIKPFAEITVDADGGKGSDSVQSYLGFDFDLSLLF